MTQVARGLAEHTVQDSAGWELLGRTARARFYHQYSARVSEDAPETHQLCSLRASSLLLCITTSLAAGRRAPSERQGWNPPPKAKLPVHCDARPASTLALRPRHPQPPQHKRPHSTTWVPLDHTPPASTHPPPPHPSTIAQGDSTRSGRHGTFPKNHHVLSTLQSACRTPRCPWGTGLTAHHLSVLTPRIPALPRDQAGRAHGALLCAAEHSRG